MASLSWEKSAIAERILFMKIKVSTYIAKKVVEHGIVHGFSVTGGGAMHLNDGFGHQS